MAIIPVIESVLVLRAHLVPLRRAGTVALVPTMGALHEGHLSLIRAACRAASHVVVSLFVNPAQFAPHEDFASYPRNLAQDVELITGLGLDGITIFAPSTVEIYPAPPVTQFQLGDIATLWEGAARPTHFAGVALVVSKLLNIVQPDGAFFGEKDFQQMQVIRQIARDLSIQVEIIGAPIMREATGLAMSSRNVYLTEAERRDIAPKLFAALKIAAEDIQSGAKVEKILLQHQKNLLTAGFTAVDYFAYVDSETLAPLAAHRPHGRMIAAARLGRTRLIDNIAVA